MLIALLIICLAFAGILATAGQGPPITWAYPYEIIQLSSDSTGPLGYT